MDSDYVEFTAEDAAKFKEYMSSKKRDMSYIMAFGLFKTKWEISDVHVSEDLLSLGTFELIDLFFSKMADVMFVWRIDSKDITDMEAKPYMIMLFMLWQISCQSQTVIGINQSTDI